MNPLAFNRNRRLSTHPVEQQPREHENTPITEDVEPSPDGEKDISKDDNSVVPPPARRRKLLFESTKNTSKEQAVESSGETARLSLSINRALHRRLKMEAVRQDRTIISLIESWIEENCPEV